MLITNHVLAGALIGTFAPGPVSAFAIGVASHFAMDMVPHWGDRGLVGRDFLEVAVPDGLIGLTTLTWLARQAQPAQRVTVLAGMLGACLPDADKPSELFFGRSPFPVAVDDWHKDIQTEHAHRMPQEIVTAALGMLLVGRLVSRAAARA